MVASHRDAPRPLEPRATMADTIRERLPEAYTSSELRAWCVEVADRVESVERGLAARVAGDPPPTAAEIAADGDEVERLELALAAAEAVSVPLVGLELAVVALLRRRGLWTHPTEPPPPSVAATLLGVL